MPKSSKAIGITQEILKREEAVFLDMDPSVGPECSLKHTLKGQPFGDT